MGKYGDAAVIAANLLNSGKENDPKSAWNQAVSHVFPDSESSRIKGCPRDTFLSMCEGGIVKGATPGGYTRSVKNRAYAMKALELLNSNPNLADDEKYLWQVIIEGGDKQHNSQMDVVTTLWRNDCINHGKL